MKTSYNLQDPPPKVDQQVTGLQATSNSSINENGARRSRMSDVDANDVSVKSGAGDQDTPANHNDSLITDLDDVSLTCLNEADNHAERNKDAFPENRLEQVTDIDNVNTLMENGTQRVGGDNEFSGHVCQYELNAHPTDQVKMKIGPYSGEMEICKISNPLEEKCPVQDPDMEAVKEYVLKIISKAREIVQTESDDAGKTHTKKSNTAKPWTRRLAEIFCFRRN